MHPLSKIFTSLTVVLAGFLFAPAAMALPGAGALKQMPVSTPLKALPLPTEQGAISDEAALDELVKQVGFRLRIGYGRRGHYYPRYYGYRRHYYSPSYRYGYRRSYRRYPRYRTYRSYRRPYRYSRRYKKRRGLRRLRRLLRHRYYY